MWPGGPGARGGLPLRIHANWLFLEPYGGVSLWKTALTATVLFLLGAVAIALLCTLFRDALFDAQRTADQLREQTVLLERSAAAARENQERSRSLEEQLRLAKDAAEMGVWNWDLVT